MAQFSSIFLLISRNTYSFDSIRIKQLNQKSNKILKALIFFVCIFARIFFENRTTCTNKVHKSNEWFSSLLTWNYGWTSEKNYCVIHKTKFNISKNAFVRNIQKYERERFNKKQKKKTIRINDIYLGGVRFKSESRWLI